MSISHDSISEFCAGLGKDPLLVQGAGGNVSWKDGNTLWVKGSGTSLANAKLADIFVPVDLKKITSSLSRGNFSITPESIITSNLHPSIETILHALMPQKIVIHLHAINPLSLLVLRDAKIKISRISNKLPWNSEFIEYFKPGISLAQAIDGIMKTKKGIRILFLKNHGIVIGGDSIVEVDLILKSVISANPIKINPEVINFAARIPKVPLQAKSIYRSFDDEEVQQLAQNPLLFFRLRSDWVLYPDHAVFLGPKAFFYESWENFFNKHTEKEVIPELIFIQNEGVFTTLKFNIAKAAQLRCYFDIVSRQTQDSRLCSLSSHDIKSVLNWDAEKYRQRYDHLKE